MNSKTEGIVMILLMITIIVLLGFTIYYVQTKGFECIQNPAIYAVNDLAISNDANVSCICRIHTILRDDDPNGIYRPGRFGFDSETQTTYQLDLVGDPLQRKNNPPLFTDDYFKE